MSKRYLIVKTSSLGDILHTFPVLDYLKKREPDCTVDWVVESRCAQLVQAHPLVEQALIINTRDWRRSLFSSATRGEVQHFRQQLRAYHYDAVFDLQGNIKSGLVVAMAKSYHKIGFTWDQAPEKLNWFFQSVHQTIRRGQNIRDDYVQIVSGYFGEDNGAQAPTTERQLLNLTEDQRAVLEMFFEAEITQNQQLVLVAPAAAWKNKVMDFDLLSQFLESAPGLQSAYFLFSWGSESERQLSTRLSERFPDRSKLLPKLEIPQLQHVMSRCRLVIAMDSLPLHLAETASTATFSVFGPSSAQKYRPIVGCHHSHQGTCPYGRVFEKRCPILRTCETGNCIKQIKLEDLLTSFSQTDAARKAVL